MHIIVRQFGKCAGGGTSKGLHGEMAPAQSHLVYLHAAHQHIRSERTARDGYHQHHHQLSFSNSEG